MNICLISPTYLPNKGGSEVAIYELSRKLAERGYNVVLVTPNEMHCAAFENVNGVEVHRTFLPRIPYGGSVAAAPFVFRKILELNKVRHFDLLHQFHVFSLGIASILAKKIIKKPLLTSLMGADTYDPLNPLWRIFAPYISWTMNNSDAITSPCNELLHHARKQGLKKEAVVIPHGVDLDRFTSHQGSGDVRKKLGMAEDEIMVLSVQRLSRRKSIEYLIGAMPKVVEENSKVKLIIGGKGTEEERLKQQVQELSVGNNVIFAGFIPDEELPAYYASCDIFAMHTTYEAFGLVFAEAMACGKPVISTSVGAIPEVIDDGKTGIIVPPKDSGALADAILKLVGDRELRLKMGEEGQKKARQKYSWNHITEQYIQVYESMLIK